MHALAVQGLPVSLINDLFDSAPWMGCLSKVLLELLGLELLGRGDVFGVAKNVKPRPS